MSVNVKAIVILKIQGVEYCCIVDRIRKKTPQMYCKKADLNEEKRVLCKMKNFITTYKMGKEIIMF